MNRKTKKGALFFVTLNSLLTVGGANDIVFVGVGVVVVVVLL